MKLKPSEYDLFFDAIMYSMYRNIGESTQAHIPIEVIISTLPYKYKTQKVYNDNFKKLMKDLVKCGYIILHKTKGGMTYNFSKDGRDYARQLSK